MKDPDKIYINVTPFGVDYSIVPILDFGGVEYIRKDALMEWAKKENLKFSHIGNERDDNFARGIAAGLGYLISKLSSL